MRTPSPGIPPLARLCFECALMLAVLPITLLTFAPHHTFIATLVFQVSIMLGILVLLRLLPYLLVRHRAHSRAL